MVQSDQVRRYSIPAIFLLVRTFYIRCISRKAEGFARRSGIECNGSKFALKAPCEYYKVIKYVAFANISSSSITSTMASSTHVLLFPHEHTDVLGALHDLSVRSKTHPRLRTFLASSSAVVAEQATAVEGLEHASIGPFEDLLDLVERHVSQQRQNVAVEMVLLTTIQISQLLVCVRKFPKRKNIVLRLGLT